MINKYSDTKLVSGSFSIIQGTGELDSQTLLDLRAGGALLSITITTAGRRGTMQSASKRHWTGYVRRK